MFEHDRTEFGDKLTRAEKEFIKSQGEEVGKHGGGLIIPDEAKPKVNQGIVKYVGTGVTDYKPGDYILFSAYSGTTVRIEGEGLFIILHEDFVTCTILPPETDIPGLYFKDIDGDYWTATHEMIFDLIARAMAENHYVQHSTRDKPSNVHRGM